MRLDGHAVGATFGIALGVTVMAAAIFTDEYASAAGAEARGLESLFHALASSDRAGAVSVTFTPSNEGKP